MPSPYVSQLAKEKGVSLDVAEDRWKRAKASAKSQGHEKDWAYITGIFKTMMGEEVEDETMLEQKLSKAVKRIEEKLDSRKLSESINLSSKEALIGSYSLLSSSGVDEYLSLNIVKNIQKDMLFLVITNEDDIRIIEHLLPPYKSIKEINSFLNKKDYYINKPIYDPFELIFNLV